MVMMMSIYTRPTQLHWWSAVDRGFEHILLVFPDLNLKRSHHGHDHMVVGLQLPFQSVPITTDVSLNPADVKVYSIQLYVIKFA
jgi:hypothetical protein